MYDSMEFYFYLKKKKQIDLSNLYYNNKVQFNNLKKKYHSIHSRINIRD